MSEYNSLLEAGTTGYLGNCSLHRKRQAGLNISGQTDVSLGCVDLLYRREGGGRYSTCGNISELSNDFSDRPM